MLSGLIKHTKVLVSSKRPGAELVGCFGVTFLDEIRIHYMFREKERGLIIAAGYSKWAAPIIGIVVLWEF